MSWTFWLDPALLASLLLVGIIAHAIRKIWRGSR